VARTGQARFTWRQARFTWRQARFTWRQARFTWRQARFTWLRNTRHRLDKAARLLRMLPAR
jgi:hypothetical protein